MTDGPGDPEHLREAFASLAETAKPTDTCPEPERLWMAAGGELAPGDLREVVDHIASCPACAEAWRLADRLKEAVPLEERAERPGPSPPATWWRFAAAAAIVLGALGVYQVVDRSDPPPVSEFRDAGPATAGIAASTPEDEPLPRGACVLSWSLEPARQGVRWEIRVTTDDLSPVAEARDLDAPRFQVPESALADLPPGTRLLWRVETTLGDGGSLTSDTFSALLE